MARTYKVEGTKDFLIWSVILLGLGLWSVRDGWFPTEKVLEKHPLKVPAAFQLGGVVAEVLVDPGEEVRDRQPLARQVRAEERRAADRAQAAFATATNRVEGTAREIETAAATGAVSDAVLAGLKETLDLQRAEAEAARKKLAEAMAALQARELLAPTGGVVRTVLVEKDQPVLPDEPAVTIDPKDHFYPFNKSLAILSLIGSAVCAYIHRIVR